MNKLGYIYKTTNLVNGKIYIGRKKGKFNENYLGSGILLKEVIPRYGRYNFKVEVLDWAITSIGLDSLEQKYIREFRRILGRNRLYNIAQGGHGTKGLTRIHFINCQCASCKSKRGELVHKIDCKCASCKSRRGEELDRTHKINCTCLRCLNLRGELHKSDCQCISCKYRRKEIHKINCQCWGCKSKRR